MLKIKVASEVLIEPQPKPLTPKVKASQKSVEPIPSVTTEVPTQEVAPQPQSTLSSTARADLRTVYISGLRSKIEANKNYPLISRRLGHTGLVVVGFTLLADGSIINVHLVKEARFERLSESAMAAVKKIGRYDPIPRELEESQIDLTVPVNFTLQ